MKQIKQIYRWFKSKAVANYARISQPNFIRSKITDIVRISRTASVGSEKNSLALQLVDGKTVYDTDRTLASYLELPHFVMINKSDIINTQHIVARTNWSLIFLDGLSKPLKVSPQYKDKLIACCS